MGQLINKENRLLLMVFALLNIFIFYVLGPVAESISYVEDAEWSAIKLLTTHFVHHSEKHLWGNVTAMALLLALFPNSNKSLVLAFTGCVLTTGIYVITHEIERFLGSSALLYCIPGCYFTNTLIKQQFIQANTILTILCVYLFMIEPISSSEGQTWSTFTAAHVIGFLAGTISQLFITAFEMRLVQDENKLPPL